MNKLKLVLRSTTIVLGIVIVGLVGWRIGRQQQSDTGSSPTAPTTYGSVADFRFTDQTNRPFGLSDVAGKIWVADFIFTSCMGPCPMLTQRMSTLQKEFTDKKDVVFVSFSVDPEHDTPAALRKYAETYQANPNRWHFLTGPRTQLFGLIRDSFHLTVESAPGQTPSMNDVLHSIYFVVVGRDGKIVGYFNTDDPDAISSLRSKIRSL